MSELNDWFLSLPEARQAVLRDDKWFLAEAAFAAGKVARAQPAQAGQVLTLDEVRESVHEAGLDWHNGWTMGEDAENRYLNLCRAIEQAVLAKRVPMTREEVKDLARKVGYDNATAQERADFINGIRHAEVWHGIGDEKGGA